MMSHHTMLDIRSAASLSITSRSVQHSPLTPHTRCAGLGTLNKRTLNTRACITIHMGHQRTRLSLNRALIYKTGQRQSDPQWIGVQYQYQDLFDSIYKFGSNEDVLYNFKAPFLGTGS